MGEGYETEAITQDYRDLSADLGREVRLGSEVFASGTILPHELVAINPEGVVTYAKQHKESYVAMDVTVGLEIVGMLRRQNVFRRRQFAEYYDTTDVQLGDKLILQTPDEEQVIVTRKLRANWGANIRAMAAKITGSLVESDAEEGNHQPELTEQIIDQSPIDQIPNINPEAAAVIAGLLGPDPKGYLDRHAAEELADVQNITRLRRRGRAAGVPDEQLPRY